MARRPPPRPPQLLDRELMYLERAAAAVDPQRQRPAAAAIKLLASALMSLSGDDDGDDSEPDSPLHPERAAGEDPFSLPAFAPAAAAGGQVAGSPRGRQLTITLYGGLEGCLGFCLRASVLEGRERRELFQV